MAALKWNIVEHGQWKAITVDKNVFKDSAADFLGLEELTDYSLITPDDDGNFGDKDKVKLKCKKEKHLSARKPKKLINKIVPQKTLITLQEQTKKEEIADQILEKKKRKRKNNKFKKNDNSISQYFNQSQEEIEIGGKRKVDGKESAQQVNKKRKLVIKNKMSNMDQDLSIISQTQSFKNVVKDSNAEEFEQENMDAWKNLFVPEPVLKALWEKRFTSPTPIQSLVLPSAIRDKKDIIGAAETGSGKTLAFGIPLIHHILKDKEKNNLSKDEGDNNDSENEGENEDGKEEVEGHQKFADEVDPSENKILRKNKLYALVLSPTRELAIQVKNHLMVAAKYTSIKIAAIVGGMASEKQERVLKRCPEIVVATPGRLWELIEQGQPHLNTITDVKYLVIDEADRMVEKGHFAELLNLLEKINGNAKKKMLRQTYIFSATLTLVHKGPDRLRWKQKKFQLTSKQKIDSLMNKIGIKKCPKVIDLSRKVGTAEMLTEMRINCSLEEKDYYLCYILTKHPGRTLVFTNSIDCIRRLNPILTLLQRQPLPLHANMHQKQRLKNLDRFSARKDGLLLATDVAARGLDIPDIQHVVHYQIPRVAETYIHRSGRTARAQKEGLSVMLIGPEETHFYRQICKTLNRDKDLPIFPVEMKILSTIKEQVILACTIDKLEHSLRAKKNSNDWFRKTAEEMDMELDEDDNICDLGDVSVQSKKIKFLRTDLVHLLKRPL